MGGMSKRKANIYSKRMKLRLRNRREKIYMKKSIKIYILRPVLRTIC